MADAAIDILLREIRRTPSSPRVIVNHVVPHQLVARDSVRDKAADEAGAGDKGR